MTKLNLKNIVAISVLLTFVFYIVSDKLPQYDFWKYSVVSGGVFLIIFCLNWIYEKWLWDGNFIVKFIFKKIGFQEYPSIAGKWVMHYYSSYKYDWDNSQYVTEGTGEIEIIKIEGGFSYKGKFGESLFKSTSNYFERNGNNKKEWVLGYKYTNTPTETNLSDTGFVQHSGVAILEFDEDQSDEIKGFYGNDENRRTRGKLILTKVMDK